MREIGLKIGLLVLTFFIAAQSAVASSMLPLGGAEDASIFFNHYEEGDSDISPKAIIKVRNNSGNLDNLSGTTATKFTFDGNGSSDAETPTYMLEVRFDFDNDGKTDTYYSKTKMATHIYETPGVKTIKMEVLDLGGNVSTAYKQVLVVENTTPDAYYEVSPGTGTKGTVFTFDASFSKDDQYNKNLLKYRFDFNGDGKWDTKFTKFSQFKHKFNTPGLKNAILEVKDPEGSTSKYRRLVYVKENHKPEAVIDIKSNKKGNILVDASASSDPDKSPLLYRWDFDYNGQSDIQVDTAWFSSTLASHFYKKGGTYLIKLMVRDEDGVVSTRILKLFIDLLS